VLSEHDMKQLRLWKDNLKSVHDEKATHWDYAPPKQAPTLPEVAPQPNKDWSPKLNLNSDPRSKNHHTEEQIDALLKQGMTTILETARADNLLAEDYLNKLKLAIIKDLTASQVQPNEQDSRPPEHLLWENLSLCPEEQANHRTAPAHPTRSSTISL
jgi:hypothetical protein